jgi:hypothetical protein
MTIAVAPATKYTLKEAESRLLNFDGDDASFAGGQRGRLLLTGGAIALLAVLALYSTDLEEKSTSSLTSDEHLSVIQSKQIILTNHNPTFSPTKISAPPRWNSTQLQ